MTDTKSIKIERIFDASVEAVWDAWTKPELIKKWWGPKNFTAPIIKIDLREGGKYLYCMRGAIKPGGAPQDLWSGGTINKIVPHKKLILTDSFSDEKGNIVDPTKFGMSKDFPREMEVTITFQDMKGKTKLTIQYAKPKSAAAYKALLSSGMESGWSESLDKLAESLN